MADLTAQDSTVNVPNVWPGAFGAYKHSRDAVRFNIGTIIGLILLSIVVSIILGGRSNTGRSGGSLLADLINVWFSAALTITFLASVRSTKISFGEALKKGGSLYLKYLGLSIVTAVVLFVSFLLLIVPFFFVLPRLVLAPYFLVDKNLGPIEALKTSWAETKGHSGKVWGIIGASLLMAILILVLIGIYFLIMYSAVMALLYVYVQSNKSAAPAAPAVAEPTAPASPVA